MSQFLKTWWIAKWTFEFLRKFLDLVGLMLEESVLLCFNFTFGFDYHLFAALMVNQKLLLVRVDSSVHA